MSFFSKEDGDNLIELLGKFASKSNSGSLKERTNHRIKTLLSRTDEDYKDHNILQSDSVLKDFMHSHRTIIVAAITDDNPKFAQSAANFLKEVKNVEQMTGGSFRKGGIDENNLNMVLNESVKRLDKTNDKNVGAYADLLTQTLQNFPDFGGGNVLHVLSKKAETSLFQKVLDSLPSEKEKRELLTQEDLYSNTPIDILDGVAKNKARSSNVKERLESRKISKLSSSLKESLNKEVYAQQQANVDLESLLSEQDKPVKKKKRKKKNKSSNKNDLQEAEFDNIENKQSEAQEEYFSADDEKYYSAEEGFASEKNLKEAIVDEQKQEPQEDKKNIKEYNEQHISTDIVKTDAKTLVKKVEQPEIKEVLVEQKEEVIVTGNSVDIVGELPSNLGDSKNKKFLSSSTLTTETASSFPESASSSVVGEPEKVEAVKLVDDTDKSLVSKEENVQDKKSSSSNDDKNLEQEKLEAVTTENKRARNRRRKKNQNSEQTTDDESLRQQLEMAIQQRDAAYQDATLMAQQRDYANWEASVIAQQRDYANWEAMVLAQQRDAAGFEAMYANNRAIEAETSVNRYITGFNKQVEQLKKSSSHAESLEERGRSSSLDRSGVSG